MKLKNASQNCLRSSCFLIYPNFLMCRCPIPNLIRHTQYAKLAIIKLITILTKSDKMKAVNELSDDELKAELTQHGYNAPPITTTTRGVLQKKLESFRAGSETISKPKTAQKKATKATASAAEVNNAPAVGGGGRMSILNGSSTEPKPGLSQHNYSLDTSSTTSQPSPPKPQQPSPRSPLRMFGALSSTTTDSDSIFAKPTGPAVKTRLSNTSIGGSIGSAARVSYQDSFERGPLFGEDDYDDDHMESSRIVSPKPGSRFRSSLGSKGYGSPLKDSSPVEKFKNIGRSAWGFFSRPLGTSTPCSESANKNTYYTPNKYRRYGPDYDSGFNSSLGKKDGGMLSPDSSRWMSYSFVGFLVLLAACYLYQAHTETVTSGLEKGKEIAGNVFNFVFSYAIFPVLVLLIVGFLLFGAYKLFQFARQRKAEEKKRLIQLVDRITDLIYEAGTAGIAEPHVRDMLMPPTKRTDADYKRWQDAARFINNEDSRIRTEIRLINGTECNVWIWSGAGKQRWQGTAVAEGSPMAKVPEHALTRCLKLRGINFSDNIVEKDSIRRELLAKMKPTVPKHLGFVSNSMENVIYMMLWSLDDAKKAFTTFHSHWFNGSMITVKYVRDERYMERFPDVE